MKVCIVHDSKFGNGKIIAQTFANAFKEAEVTIEHIKKISPGMVVQDTPDLIIIGTAVRIFRISRASKKWLKKLHNNLVKTGKQIDFAAGYVTHMRDVDKVSTRIEGFYNLLNDISSIKKVYPNWILGQVEDVEGPLKKGVLNKIRQESLKLINWIESQSSKILTN